jgi:hypothetical protein
MPLGTYGKEIVNLNIDSLWRGGPFENAVRTVQMCTCDMMPIYHTVQRVIPQVLTMRLTELHGWESLASVIRRTPRDPRLYLHSWNG